MKKTLMLVLAVLLVAMLSFSVSAASAFEQLQVEDAVIIDDDTTQSLGGSGNPIQLVDGYGVGYSSLNDAVEFEAVNFGDNGAKAMTIYFSYGNDDDTVTTLDVMIDNPDSTPVCSFEIGYTGGWESTKAQEFTTDCTITGGEHDVYVRFTNEKSGSFTWISFTEGDPAPVTEAETEAAVEAVTETVTTQAPQTFDVMILASAAVLSAGAVIVAKKRK